MITVYTGLPGSGKTVQLVQKCVDTLQRNATLYKKYNVIRKVYTNLPLSPFIVKKASFLLEQFKDIYSMPQWKDCDIFIDELAVYFDSHDWERLPQEIKAYLRLHRHYKVQITAVAQDFLTVDKSFRRLVNHLYHINRIMGFGEPTLDKPNPKRPWLFSWYAEVKQEHYEIEKEHYQYIPMTRSYELYRKKNFCLYDTHADLPEQPLPPLRKIVRTCPEDGYKRVRYI